MYSIDNNIKKNSEPANLLVLSFSEINFDTYSMFNIKGQEYLISCWDIRKRSCLGYIVEEPCTKLLRYFRGKPQKTLLVVLEENIKLSCQHPQITMYYLLIMHRQNFSPRLRNTKESLRQKHLWYFLLLCFINKYYILICRCWRLYLLVRDGLFGPYRLWDLHAQHASSFV